MAQLLSKREKTILYALPAIIIFVLGFNLLAGTFLKKGEALNREISVQRLKIYKYSKLLKQKAEINQSFRKLSVQGEAGTQGVDPIVSALTEIEGLAKAANVRIIEIRPEPGSKGYERSEAVIMLRTEADMEGYFKFLHSLENSIALLTIDKFLLNARPSSRILEGTISLSQAFSPQEPAR